MMSKLILIASLGLSLSACTTAATPTSPTQDTTASGSVNAGTNVSTDVSTDVSVDTSTDASLAIEPKNLSRTQFISAMTCAEVKADASNKALFSVQKSVFSSSDSEAGFNTVMGLGGGGQYVIYKQAVALGCTGR